MEFGFRNILGYSTCSNSGTQDILAGVFKKILKVRFFRKVVTRFCGLSRPEIAFVHCQFQSGFSNALKCCSQVFNQVLGLVGSYVYVVQVLRELICFDNFDQIFAHEA